MRGSTSELWKVDFGEDWTGESLRPVKFTPVAYENRQASPNALVGALTDHGNDLGEFWKDGQRLEDVAWGIGIGATEGEILEKVNSAFARMHGYEANELFGKPITDVCPDEYLDDMADQLMVAYRKGQHVYKSRHMRKDGSIFPVKVEVKIVNGQNNQSSYRVVQVHDITMDSGRAKVLHHRESSPYASVKESSEQFLLAV